MRLDAETRDKTKRLFDLVGVKQNEFCAAYNVPSPGLSSALSGKRSIPDYLWSRVLSGLEREILERNEKATNSLWVATAQSLLNNLNESAGRSPLLRTMPGGPLPERAAVYVVRECDAVVIDALNRGGRLISVSGAPQSGRSSLLLRVATWATSLGYNAVTIDFSNFISPKSHSAPDLLSELAAAAALDCSVEPRDLRFFDLFCDQIHAQSKRSLFVLDGVDRLGLADFEKAYSILVFLVRLSGHFALNAPDKFAAVVTSGAEAWNGPSAFAAQMQSVRTVHFSKSQLLQFAKAINGNTVEADTIEAAYSLFHGHPYLSHLFLEDVAKGTAVSEAVEIALSLHGPYGTHAARIVRRIQAVVTGWPNGATANYDELCQQIAGLSHDRPRREIAHYLKFFGVRDSGGTTCKFYQRVFEQEASPK